MPSPNTSPPSPLSRRRQGTQRSSSASNSIHSHSSGPHLSDNPIQNYFAPARQALRHSNSAVRRIEAIHYLVGHSSSIAPRHPRLFQQTLDLLIDPIYGDLLSSNHSTSPPSVQTVVPNPTPSTIAAADDNTHNSVTPNESAIIAADESAIIAADESAIIAAGESPIIAEESSIVVDGCMTAISDRTAFAAVTPDAILHVAPIAAESYPGVPNQVLVASVAKSKRGRIVREDDRTKTTHICGDSGTLVDAAVSTSLSPRHVLAHNGSRRVLERSSDRWQRSECIDVSCNSAETTHNNLPCCGVGGTLVDAAVSTSLSPRHVLAHNGTLQHIEELHADDFSLLSNISERSDEQIKEPAMSSPISVLGGNAISVADHRRSCHDQLGEYRRYYYEHE